MRHRVCCIAALALAGAAAPAPAEVTAASDSGFVSHNEVRVDVPPRAVWDAMVRPAEWWNGDHSYSGDPANMTIVPSAGGCFCETIPGEAGAAAGQIEHMRVIYAAPGSTLRLTGALGPLQSEAVTAVLTMSLEPDGESTRISWDYVVGGYMRRPMGEMAPLVDRVIGEQLLRLAQRLGKAWDAAEPPRRR